MELTRCSVRHRRSSQGLILFGALVLGCVTFQLGSQRLFVGTAAQTEGDLSDATSSKIRTALVVGFVQIVALLALAGLSTRRPQGKAWEGADIKLVGICFAVGWIVRFLLPIPSGVTPQAWSMLAIFVAMICGVVIGPLPPAGVTTVTLAVAVFTNTITFQEGLRAFTDEVVWMVLLAFFFAEGFGKTGLGERLGLTVIGAVGSTTLGLAYGLNFAELMVAAAMPSSAARAAAVFYPITLSVCKASGSDPAKGTEKKIGSFLVECCYQATATSSCLFLTGAAQNYFVLKLAAGIGVEVPSPFKTWFLAALAPAIASFILAPLVAFKLLPPEAKSTPEAPEIARKKLQDMGPASDDEKVFGFVMLSMVASWATASSTGIPPVVTALCGLAVLILAGVITWDDCAKNHKAWGTFVSFASLVGLASMLNTLGIVKWLASSITEKILAAGFSSVPAFFIILASYWIVHYLFASQVAHVSALFQPFLLMMIQTGTPPIAATFALAFASNLFMTMTPYASAQSAVIFGGKYVSVGEWYKCGFCFFVFYIFTWIVVGAPWWRFLGLI